MGLAFGFKKQIHSHGEHLDAKSQRQERLYTLRNRKVLSLDFPAIFHDPPPDG
jgi:hypothetical protein